MRPYRDIPGLEDLYLEDSWVLAIGESVSELRFELDAVLTEAHPKWSAPKPDEQYAYLGVDLVFESPRRVEWIEKKMRPFRDATGETDYGNIDSFEWDGEQYDLRGDWGHVRIESLAVSVIER